MKKLLAYILCASLLLVPISAFADLGNNPPNPAPEHASIVSVSLSASSHLAGFAAQLQVTLQTANVSDGTTAVFRLVSAGSPAVPVAGVERSGSISNNALSLTLSLPEDLAAGSYRVEVSLASLGLSDTSASYLVRQDANPAIVGTSVNPATGTVGQHVEVEASIVTFAVDDGSPAVAVLQDPNGLPVQGVSGQGVVVGNNANIALQIPGTLAAGIYNVETTIGTLRDVSGTFTILPEGQSNLPPVASALTVLGTPQVGNTLSGLYMYSDAENDPQGASLLRWLRADSAMSTQSHVGSGSTYQLTAADQGKYLRFEVTPRAISGQPEGVPVQSSAVGPIMAAPSGGTGGGGGGVFIPPTQPPVSPPVVDPNPDEETAEPKESVITIVDVSVEVDDETGRSNTVYSATDDLMDEIADALAAGAGIVTLTVGTEVPTDTGSGMKVQLSGGVLQQLAEAEGVSLVIKTAYGSLQISPDVLEVLAATGEDASFTFTWGEAADVSELLPVSLTAANSPLWVESHVTGPMEVTMALDIPLPEDDGQRARYLERLRIFAVHSDGEQRIMSLSSILVDSDVSPAVLRSVTFAVTKFSSFTLVELTAPPLVTVIGSRGYSVAERFVDMPPCYYRGNDTMMPVRMLEEFGVGFEWDQSTGTATLTFLSTVVRLTIGSATADINGTPVPIVGASGRSIAPELAPGRTMIPLRFVSEKLLFAVHWDETNTVTVAMK